MSKLPLFGSMVLLGTMAALSVLMFASQLTAQNNSAIDKIDPASLTDSSRSLTDRLADVYAYAQEATKKEQIEIVLTACQAIVDESQEEEQRTYASNLAGWANFRMGDLWLGDAIAAYESQAEDGEVEIEVQLDEAMARFDKALAVCPSLHRAEHGKGIVYSMRGDLERAKASFDKVVAHEPTFAQAHFNRAECCLKLGMIDEALDSYDAGIEQRPQDPAGYTGRGHAYFAKNEFQLALLDYRRTVQLEPYNSNGLINRGDAQLALGNWSKALDDYREARSADPKGMVPIQRIAMLKAACPDVFYRNEPAAYELALASIEANGGKATPLTLDTLAAAQAANGWFEDAVETMELAENLAPESFNEAMQARKKMYQAGNPFLLETVRR